MDQAYHTARQTSEGGFLLQAYLNLPEVTQKNTPSRKRLFFIIVINSVNRIRLLASDNKMVCLSLTKSQ